MLGVFGVDAFDFYKVCRTCTPTLPTSHPNSIQIIEPIMRIEKCFSDDLIGYIAAMEAQVVLHLAWTVRHSCL